MTLSTETVLGALAKVTVAGSTRCVVDLLEDVTVDGDRVRLLVAPGSPSASLRDALEQPIESAVRAVGAAEVVIEWNPSVRGREVRDDDAVPGVKNVILVMSGKGGVGKSTVAANLALGLSRMGTKVGLLDADIYGPSVPTLFGINEQPTSDGQKIQPIERYGLKLMSMGFLLEEPQTAVIWRGPMLHGALMQFLRDVAWGNLDYLLLDLPPGTGDVALTLAQQVQSSGAVIVTTPQEMALQDVYKAVGLCKKVGIPVLGVVENQSVFVCDHCGHRHELFGSGGGRKVAELAEAPLLGQVPLDPAIRQASDAGLPVVQGSPESASARALFEVAEKVADRTAEAVLSASGPTIDRSGGSKRHLPMAR
jgi:ATP-binding protein involved in chromosome partitioning